LIGAATALGAVVVASWWRRAKGRPWQLDTLGCLLLHLPEAYKLAITQMVIKAAQVKPQFLLPLLLHLRMERNLGLKAQGAAPRRWSRP